MIDSTQQTGNTGSTETPKTTTQKQDKLGSEAFLRLLVTQLQNQDPTAPQSNTEFIAQLATFSQLEQLTSINRTMTAMSKFLGVPDTSDSSNSNNSSGN